MHHTSLVHSSQDSPSLMATELSGGGSPAAQLNSPQHMICTGFAASSCKWYQPAAARDMSILLTALQAA